MNATFESGEKRTIYKERSGRGRYVFVSQDVYFLLWHFYA